MAKCGMKTEIYSRVCGYHRPIRNWNRGKQEEFGERQVYNPTSSTKKFEERQQLNKKEDGENGGTR